MPPTGTASETVIASGCVVRGDIETTSPLKIEGEILSSKIVGDRIVIGETGKVEGRIEAREIKISGKVVGDVRCSERVEITGSGAIEGNVDSPRLVIAEGGTLRGSTQMGRDRGDATTPAALMESQEPEEDRGI